MHAGAAAGFTLSEIAARLGGEIVGDAGVRITGIRPLETATGVEIAFLANTKYRPLLETTGAGAVIVSEADRAATALPRIVTVNPYLYFARLTLLFYPPAAVAAGIHPDALVEPGAQIPASASIAAFAQVGRNARIGERAIIGSGSSIGANVVLGDDSRLYPRVVIYDDCVIGSRVILHSGVVIGADGFGLAQDEGRWVKIPQVGRAVIGDDVEIGANTTVDRGALDDTVIEDGVKLDNQIQIGHNCRIGAHTAIAGCVGIAGSTRVGRHCTIGGGVGIVGHIEICDHTHIAGFTLVSKSIRKPGAYASGLPIMEHADWLKAAAHVRGLDKLAQKVRALQERITKLERE